MEVVIINIFTTLNDAYYPRLRVFVRTLRKHTDELINLTILHFSLSEKKITEFKKIASKFNINVKFFLVDKKQFEYLKLINHITYEAYTKLLVLQIYPTEDKALWIDVDTIVIRDIKELYNEEISDYYVLGVPERKEKLDIERLRLGANATYFNAGVILFNLARIRASFSNEELFEIYAKHQSAIRFADQDVINIAFSSKVKRDETAKYNYMIRSGHILSKDEKKWIKENAVIIHFIRHIKPWHYCYQGKARFFYLKEMFPIYPFKTILLFIIGELYKLVSNKKSLEE